MPDNPTDNPQDRPSEKPPIGETIRAKLEEYEVERHLNDLATTIEGAVRHGMARAGELAHEHKGDIDRLLDKAAEPEFGAGCNMLFGDLAGRGEEHDGTTHGVQHQRRGHRQHRQRARNHRQPPLFARHCSLSRMTRPDDPFTVSGIMSIRLFQVP